MIRSHSTPTARTSGTAGGESRTYRSARSRARRPTCCSASWCAPVESGDTDVAALLAAAYASIAQAAERRALRSERRFR
jgi:hypothetical protein